MTKLSAWKMAGAVLLLWAATAIASQAQVFNVLVNFDGANGAQPYSALVQGVDGNFYGTTSLGGPADPCEKFGCGTLFQMTPGGSLATLHLTDADGSYPVAGLTVATDGNFYGTASSSGTNTWGTVFEVTKTGNLTTLYNFCAQINCADGGRPYGALIQATDGDFYG